MGEKVYFLDVRNSEDGGVAFAFGDVETISYVANRAIKKMKDNDGGGAEYSVIFREVKEGSIGTLTDDNLPYDDETVRVISNFTGDAEDAIGILQRRIKKEREANGGARRGRKPATSAEEAAGVTTAGAPAMKTEGNE